MLPVAWRQSCPCRGQGTHTHVSPVLPNHDAASPACRPSSNHPAWFAPSVPAPANDMDAATSLHRGHQPRPRVQLTTRPSPPRCSIYTRQGQTSIKPPRDAEFNPRKPPFVGLWTGAETPWLGGWALHSSVSGDAGNSEHRDCSRGSSSPFSQRFGCWHLGQKAAAQPWTRALRAPSNQLHQRLQVSVSPNPFCLLTRSFTCFYSGFAQVLRCRAAPASARSARLRHLAARRSVDPRSLGRRDLHGSTIHLQGILRI